ncbi:2,3-dihydro-2,3-dihydroxybenzoate dehydrogenase [Actinokineospora pegani]|uniref:2,3-dihydro-2,3-dihydroxybenzoate dehydrogenase n=1 Tax=Actinokineospora pegani TaxID=2654637 RepID=UPI0012EA9429|nr:2,3-dihydro-2,3-dihydroxybenzoate dehydrogenase [Actinokineospora pegani]
MVEGLGGRVALVTGAGRGIGAAVVDALVAAGCVVVGLDVDPGAGGADRVRRVDVGDRDAVEAAVAEVEAGTGPIDILVNVAGVLRTGSVVDITPEDWAQVLRTNLDGVFHTSQAVARRMVRRERGAIVTIGSNSVGVPRMGLAAYSASKAAAMTFTRCLGLELAGSGVRCNIVSPGSTDTPMQRSMWDDEERGAAELVAGRPERFWNGVPLGRIATPADVADAVLFLVSDQARHITMQNIYVDGGASLCA